MGTEGNRVALDVALTFDKRCKLVATADKWADKGEYARESFHPGKQSVFRESERVADGSRTHDLRNHNPTDPISNLLTATSVTTHDPAACAISCTKIPANSFDQFDQSQNAANLRRLGLIDSEPDLATIVDRWSAIPDPVRQAILMLARAIG
jgi:hypothetical protein